MQVFMNQPTIVAKFHYKSEIRRKRISTSITFGEFTDFVFKLFSLSPKKKNNFKLKYLDDESEFITFIDSFDLTEALELCQTFQPPYLKVFIFEETQEIKNSNMPSLKFSSKNSNSALGSEDLSQLVQIQDKIDSLLQRPYTTYRNRTVQPLWNSQQMTSVSSRNYHKIISQKKKPKIRRNKKKKQKKKIKEK
eukprot:Anaeramoba_flamelloidesa330549_30.p1 GENE.a330549_30~~a330549_30.p1  ORF type:complete len:200 (-),score=49.37 a330549_30:151-729(-)